MIRPAKIIAFLLASLSFTFAPALRAQSPPANKTAQGANAPRSGVQKSEPTQFIRLQRDEKKQPIALETAIVRSIDVREGQRVRAGEVLARLDKAVNEIGAMVGGWVRAGVEKK